MREKRERERADLESVIQPGKGIMIADGEDEMDEEDCEEGEGDGEYGELRWHRVGESWQHGEVGIRSELVHAHRHRPDRSECRRGAVGNSPSAQSNTDPNGKRRAYAVGVALRSDSSAPVGVARCQVLIPRPNSQL